MSARGGAAAPLLALLGGLAVAAGGAGTWAVRTSVRDVGGVPLRQTEGVAGTVLAPLALPAGLLLVVVALAALVLRARLPRAAAGALLAVSFGAVAVVADGIVRATVAEGRLGAAPWAAAAGAVLAVLAGLAAWRVPVAGPVLDERYTVEGAGPGDDEWDMAADEPKTADGGTGDGGPDDPGTPLR